MKFVLYSEDNKIAIKEEGKREREKQRWPLEVQQSI